MAARKHSAAWKMTAAATSVISVLLAAMPVAAFAAIPTEMADGSKADRGESAVTLDVTTTNPTMLSGKRQTTYVQISLTGAEVRIDPDAAEDRGPVNVAIVIDTSGSMKGDKIRRAKEAAIEAVELLGDDDIVSIITYADAAHVMVPATKATSTDDIVDQIKAIRATGSTALFAGVSRGADEVRKFLNDQSVNRVILLSDGQANRGPSSPGELARLGASLVKEGVSVSTFGLGLGYNEDLMAELASAGSGNHLFIQSAENLAGAFQREINDLMSVVAGDFEISIDVAEGIRPVKVLGTTADIDGQNVFLPLAQLYGGQKRYFVLELDVPAGDDGSVRDLVEVSVKYQNKLIDAPESLAATRSVRFSEDAAVVEKATDLKTLAGCTIQVANDVNRRATQLRDAGDIDAAQKLLLSNSVQLKALSFRCAEVGLDEAAEELNFNDALNFKQAQVVAEKDWGKNRKMMRSFQNLNSAQQSSAGDASGIVPPKSK